MLKIKINRNEWKGWNKWNKKNKWNKRNKRNKWHKWENGLWNKRKFRMIK